MTVTPETLVRHELVGLAVAVRAASNSAFDAIEGSVVGETTRTLDIEGADGTVRRVPKDAATFAFTLPDGQVVAVDGERLVARPARRTEQRGESPWRSA